MILCCDTEVWCTEVSVAVTLLTVGINTVKPIRKKWNHTGSLMGKLCSLLESPNDQETADLNLE